MAYTVWFAEHEFHIMVDADFPLMKFWNWFDEYNIKQYNRSQDHNSDNSDYISTMG